jgi:hypothetical protein
VAFSPQELAGFAALAVQQNQVIAEKCRVKPERQLDGADGLHRRIGGGKYAGHAAVADRRDGPEKPATIAVEGGDDLAEPGKSACRAARR